ncbi:MAG: HD domain-containing phosphohydrolase [Candidatus Omnitrophota bacterium]|nr:HD domain-containing phosphohydrolase [Candidatus Omnitrophota bacterium]
MKKYKTAFAAMHAVYRLINSTFDLKNLLLRLARLTSQIMSVDYCSIALLDPIKKYSYLRAVVTPRKRCVINKRISITNRLELKIIRSGSATYNGNIIGIPLIGEDLMGIIIMRRSKKTEPFEQFDQEILLNISSQAIMAIRNLQLYEEQQRTIMGSIKSLVTLLDIRSARGYTHTSNFLRLVLSLAREMHLGEEEICSLEYATLLHDAGKINIPSEILAKPEKLTCQEFNIIKDHPLKGVEIIKHLQVLRPALPIIMHHHEKYDGTGYPSGLKKGQIPIGARIMAVADAFEAMVYGRPYRERISIKEAIGEIEKYKGTQFDPEVVDSFLRLAKKSKKYLQLK